MSDLLDMLALARVIGWANRKIQPEDPTLSFYSVVKKAGDHRGLAPGRKVGKNSRKNGEN